MSFVINTNVSSLVAQQNLDKSNNMLNQAITRLSSGSRINSAADDAAGQAIGNRMNAQITGLSQAKRNSNDGISLAQTAEGALDAINDNLQRMRELSVEAANGTYSSTDLQSIQDEIEARRDEIDRIAEQTTFNGINVLNTSTNVFIQVGANSGETIEIDLEKVSSSTLGSSSNVSDINVTTVDGSSGEHTGASTALDILDEALQDVDKMRSNLGVIQNRFDSAINNLGTMTTNLQSAHSRIMDANYAEVVSQMSKGQILQQAGTAVLSQANQSQQSVLSLLR